MHYFQGDYKKGGGSVIKSLTLGCLTFFSLGAIQPLTVLRGPTLVTELSDVCY